jgi:hypothetical protein
MTTRGIIFTGDEVRATLDGRKSQFRRAMRPQPNGVPIDRSEWPNHSRYITRPCPNAWFPFRDEKHVYALKPPFGHVGDQLFVKETWCGGDSVSTDAGSFDVPVMYRADCNDAYAKMRWRSPVHMPQWSSRLTLEVTGVRVQRVTEITEEDAKAEGARPLLLQDGQHGCWQTCAERDGATMHSRTAIGEFEKSWDSRNPKHPWARNPWVWALTFKGVRP